MSAGKILAALFVLLLVAHQDFWWKDDSRLVFGILPISLAYHVFWTVLVAVGWYLVTRYAWPAEKPAVTKTAAPVTAKHER